MVENSEHNAPKEDRFFKLFSLNQGELFTYIVTLVPNSADAEDIFQETCSVMWRKFADFQPGTNFTAWACKVAYFIIIEHRRRESKSRIRYSSDTLKLLAESYTEYHPENSRHVETLNDCLKNLSEKERLLIQQRYNKALPVKAIADQVGVSINMIYKSLAKVHYFLLECIRRNVLSNEQA